MKQIKVMQCAYFGCPEVVISGEYCFKHRRYEQAVLRDYCKRSAPNKQMTNTIRSKPILDIDKTNSKETLVNS